MSENASKMCNMFPSYSPVRRKNRNKLVACRYTHHNI